MIKIRSTEKKAVSSKNGLCDITREILSYSEDAKKGLVKIIIKDELIKEQTVQVETPTDNDPIITEVTERVIIESKTPAVFVFTSAQIDGIFSSIGVTISKTKSYTEQQDNNKTIILIAQTITAAQDQSGWYGMVNWIPDTQHTVVNIFSE